MAKVIAGMTMSLDGFVHDRRGRVGALYADLATLRNTDPMREAIRQTGAVVMGWTAFAMAADPDSYAGNYEFQVPIFVLTRAAPSRRPRETGTLTFTFVTEGIGSAIRWAMAAGLRLFDDVDAEQIRLERTKVTELPAGRTHLEFRVQK